MCAFSCACACACALRVSGLRLVSPDSRHRRERRFTEVGLASAEVSPKDLAAKQRYEAQRFQTKGLTRNAPPPQPDPLERADSPEPLEACSVSPRKHPQCALGDTLSSQQVDATAEVCGIGVQFRTDRNGSMVVQSLIEGGPADLSHAVFEGDILFMVTVCFCPCLRTTSLCLKPIAGAGGRKGPRSQALERSHGFCAGSKR